jgi:hypothetical protein
MLRELNQTNGDSVMGPSVMGTKGTEASGASGAPAGVTGVTGKAAAAAAGGGRMRREGTDEAEGDWMVGYKRWLQHNYLPGGSDTLVRAFREFLYRSEGTQGVRGPSWAHGTILVSYDAPSTAYSSGYMDTCCSTTPKRRTQQVKGLGCRVKALELGGVCGLCYSPFQAC